MKKVLLFILLIIQLNSFACKCAGWAGNFYEVCSKASLIVLVDIKKSASNFKIKAATIKVYKGKTKKRISVYLGNGLNCRPGINQLDLESQYIFALFEDKKGFFLSSCGDYFLKVQNNQVSSYREPFSEDRKKWVETEFKGNLPYMYGIEPISLGEFEIKLSKVLKETTHNQK